MKRKVEPYNSFIPKQTNLGGCTNRDLHIIIRIPKKYTGLSGPSTMNRPSQVQCVLLLRR